jgi:hypothetical protein
VSFASGHCVESDINGRSSEERPEIRNIRSGRYSNR